MIKEQDERTHFEIMESLGQLNLFDVMDAKQHQNDDKVAICIGDKVQIQIDHNDVDAYGYFVYYYPHFLQAIGEVIGTEKDLYKVRVKADVLLFHAHELLLV